MKLKGPLITLAVGVAVAATLLVLDLRATPASDDNTVAGPATVTGPTAGATTPPPSATPSATPVPASPPAGTYAGSVDGGSGASVAIAVKNGRAVAYVCDGHQAEAWLQGPADEGTVALTGAGKASLSANYLNQHLTGKVTAAGRTWTFTVGLVKPPSGLYRAAAEVRQAKVVGGWIVLPDGRQVGVVNDGGTEREAPRLDTTTLTSTVDDTTITATAVDGTPLALEQ